MTQKFYLHDAATGDTGTLPSVWKTTPTQTAATGATNRAADGTPGAAQQSVAMTVGLFETDAYRRFVTAPLAAQTIAAGNWVAAVGYDSTAGAGEGPDIYVYGWRPSTGAQVGSDIIPLNGFGTSPATTEKGAVATIAGGAITLLDGDILVFEFYATEFAGVGGTDHFYYDGTTDPVDAVAVASAASYVQAPVDLPLSGSGPAQGRTVPAKVQPYIMFAQQRTKRARYGGVQAARLIQQAFAARTHRPTDLGITTTTWGLASTVGAVATAAAPVVALDAIAATPAAVAASTASLAQVDAVAASAAATAVGVGALNPELAIASTAAAVGASVAALNPELAIAGAAAAVGAQSVTLAGVLALGAVVAAVAAQAVTITALRALAAAPAAVAAGTLALIMTATIAAAAAAVAVGAGQVVGLDQMAASVAAVASSTSALLVRGALASVLLAVAAHSVNLTLPGAGTVWAIASGVAGAGAGVLALAVRGALTGAASAVGSATGTVRGLDALVAAAAAVATAAGILAQQPIAGTAAAVAAATFAYVVWNWVITTGALSSGWRPGALASGWQVRALAGGWAPAAAQEGWHTGAVAKENP